MARRRWAAGFSAGTAWVGAGGALALREGALVVLCALISASLPLLDFGDRVPVGVGGGDQPGLEVEDRGEQRVAGGLCPRHRCRAAASGKSRARRSTSTRRMRYSTDGRADADVARSSARPPRGGRRSPSSPPRHRRRPRRRGGGAFRRPRHCRGRLRSSPGGGTPRSRRGRPSSRDPGEGAVGVGGEHRVDPVLGGARCPRRHSRRPCSPGSSSRSSRAASMADGRRGRARPSGSCCR